MVDQPPPVPPAARAARARIDDRMRVIREMAKGIGVAVAEIARTHNADPPTTSIALMMAAYSMTKFSSKPLDAERRYWEAAGLAKDLFEKGAPRSEMTTTRLISKVVEADDLSFRIENVDVIWPVHQQDAGRVEVGDVVTIELPRGVANRSDLTDEDRAGYTLVNVSKAGNPAFRG